VLGALQAALVVIELFAQPLHEVPAVCQLALELSDERIALAERAAQFVALPLGAVGGDLPVGLRTHGLLHARPQLNGDGKGAEAGPRWRRV